MWYCRLPCLLRPHTASLVSKIERPPLHTTMRTTEKRRSEMLLAWGVISIMIGLGVSVPLAPIGDGVRVMLQPHDDNTSIAFDPAALYEHSMFFRARTRFYLLAGVPGSGLHGPIPISKCCSSDLYTIRSYLEANPHSNANVSKWWKGIALVEFEPLRSLLSCANYLAIPLLYEHVLKELAKIMLGVNFNSLVEHALNNSLGDTEVADIASQLTLMNPFSWSSSVSSNLDGDDVDTLRALLSWINPDVCRQLLNEMLFGAVTSLTAAVKHGCSPAVLNILLENGADPDAGSWSSSHLHPLYVAFEMDASLSVIFLLAKATNLTVPHGCGDFPIHWACEKGTPAAVQCLIRAGADVNPVSHHHPGTPLQIGIRRNNAVMVRILIDAGAEVNVSTSTTGRHDTILHHAASQNAGSHIMIMLLAEGIDVNARDDVGRTALFVAAEQGNADALLFLASVPGVDVHAGDMFRCAPLVAAARSGNRDCVAILLRAGALRGDDHVQDGSMALFEANMLPDSSKHKTEIVQMLKDAGAVPPTDDMTFNHQARLFW
ncbi:Ankyrin repeat domain-containing protein [Plasmodiophora brassicae]